jgi:hypothetical protein
VSVRLSVGDHGHFDKITYLIDYIILLMSLTLLFSTLKQGHADDTLPGQGRILIPQIGVQTETAGLYSEKYITSGNRIYVVR